MAREMVGTRGLADAFKAARASHAELIDAIEELQRTIRAQLAALQQPA